MDMPEIHLEELKKDPEFLANIKRLEQECKEEESIAKGYQLLDAQLVIEASEDDINEVFTFIVNTAFDRLAEYLSTHKSFNMNDIEERASNATVKMIKRVPKRCSWYCTIPLIMKNLKMR